MFNKDALVGEKINFDVIKMHGTTMKIIVLLSCPALFTKMFGHFTQVVCTTLTKRNGLPTLFAFS
jgi:hypothetical protein